jgi:hypothetical protein
MTVGWPPPSIGYKRTWLPDAQVPNAPSGYGRSIFGRAGHARGRRARAPASGPHEQTALLLASMPDLDLFDRINALSSEEEQLWASAGGGAGLTQVEIDRLDAIKVELDRCYDLLHQRQARAAAGLDPDDAEARSAETVEGYEQ